MRDTESKELIQILWTGTCFWNFVYVVCWLHFCSLVECKICFCSKFYAKGSLAPIVHLCTQKWHSDASVWNSRLQKNVTRVKTLQSEFDLNQSSTRQQANTRWKFYKLTEVTLSAVLLHKVPTGCKNAVLPDELIGKCSVSCSTFENSARKHYKPNFCLLRTLGFRLHWMTDWRKRSSKCLPPPYKELKTLIHLNIYVSEWMFF